MHKRIEEKLEGGEQERFFSESFEGGQVMLYSWPGHHKKTVATVWTPEQGTIQFQDDDYKEWYWFTNDGSPFREGVEITKLLSLQGEIEDVEVFNDGIVTKMTDEDLVVLAQARDEYFSLHNPEHIPEDEE